jgi:hypothetical protein
VTTKLKIDLAQGILEVEGSEVFVKAIYNDFKAHFIGEEAAEDPFKPKRTRRTKRTSKTTTTPTKPEPVASLPEQKPEVELTTPEPVSKLPIPAPKPEAPAPKPEAPAPKPEAPAPKPEAPAPKPTYTFLEDLDLSATDGRPSLVEFMDSKFPITNEERNLVFIHYLQNILKIKMVTIDHIYTCYKAAKIRVPLNIEHSLQTTTKQYRWIRVTKTGKLSVTPAGKNYVEKQLPKKLKS